MRIFIAAIVALIVSGCAGGFNAPQLGGSGNWANEALNPQDGTQ